MLYSSSCIIFWKKLKLKTNLLIQLNFNCLFLFNFLSCSQRRLKNPWSLQAFNCPDLNDQMYTWIPITGFLFYHLQSNITIKWSQGFQPINTLLQTVILFLPCDINNWVLLTVATALKIKHFNNILVHNLKKTKTKLICTTSLFCKKNSNAHKILQTPLPSGTVNSGAEPAVRRKIRPCSQPQDKQQPKEAGHPSQLWQSW